MRRRLGSFLRDFENDVRQGIARLIEQETGARVPLTNYVGIDLDRFVQEAELRDVLDSITHIFCYLHARGFGATAMDWMDYARRVLAEEHTTYALAVDGSVNYAVDELYASVRKATVAGLDDPRWAESRAEFERAFEAMDRDPPDTNGAIRAIAASVESASKVILGGSVSRVGVAEIERNLVPVVKALYANDDAAANASQMMLKAYADWTSATHQYRHGQGAPTEGHAPTEIAINLLTSGSATLRWLVGLEFPAAN